MTLPEPVREALDRAYKYRGLYSHGFLRWDELDAIRDHIATLTAERDALAQRCAELADDFRGCAEHSRHKQAAEAWNYCADKIAAIHQETRHAG
jgi:hypothetical protein